MFYVFELVVTFSTYQIPPTFKTKVCFGLAVLSFSNGDNFGGDYIATAAMGTGLLFGRLDLFSL